MWWPLLFLLAIPHLANFAHAALQQHTDLNDISDLGGGTAPIGQYAPGSLYVNESEHPGELCDRVCGADDTRVCYFKFTLEHYQAMGVACGLCVEGVEDDCERPQCITGDGVEKGVMSINRRVPGPPIQVCRGDLLVVDVVNQAQGTAAAIHWHGQHMHATPWMDGVPFVTQCPIPFANTFRYHMWATEPGTHFYHSHSGHHKVNGQYGALVVRQPLAEDPIAGSYDHDLPEHHILISDWMHAYGEQFFPGLPGSRGIVPDSVLINGRGAHIDAQTGSRRRVPPTRYYVKPSKRYRFRVINAASHACPFQLQVERHTLSVVATDSYEVRARPVDTLVCNSGERYDFVLHANHTAGDFWVRVRGLGICGNSPTEAFALLRYVSNAASADDYDRALPAVPAYTRLYPYGIVLNHPNVTCFDGARDHCVTELKALDVDEDLMREPPDAQFFLAFNNYPVDNAEIFEPGKYNHFSNLQSNLTVVGAINELSLVFPDYPPLTQPADIDESQFCNEFQRPAACAGSKLCPCIHLLKVPLGSKVELIIVDESRNVGRMHHPFHLHGYRFAVKGLGQHPLGLPMNVATARMMAQVRMLPGDGASASTSDGDSELLRPPFKDTVSIPSRGFAVVRFRANNPGFWLMHCHYEWHLAIGMGLILQVGEPQQMPAPPHKFPRCGNYMPRIRRPGRMQRTQTTYSAH